MSPLQLVLRRVAEELKIKIVIPFSPITSHGSQVVAQALIPQFGNKRGMLVVTNMSDFCGREDELWEDGYGLSVLIDPLPHEQYNVEVYKAVLMDWRWNGPDETRPDWMV